MTDSFRAGGGCLRSALSLLGIFRRSVARVEGLWVDLGAAWSVARRDIFTCAHRVMCYCVISASAYTSAGPLSLKQNGVYTYVTTSGCTDSHTAHSLEIANTLVVVLLRVELCIRSPEFMTTTRRPGRLFKPLHDCPTGCLTVKF